MLVNFNHLNENTNAETNLNNNSFFRLNTSRNDFLQFPYMPNFNFNLNSNNQNFVDNNNQIIDVENNNYTNTESLFEEADEEYPNQDGFEQEINYGNSVEEVYSNLGLIIENEKYIYNIYNFFRDKIKSDKEKLTLLKKNFVKSKMEFMKKFQEKVKEWKDSITLQNQDKFKDNDIIELDIGGTAQISTTRGILVKVNKFILLFSIQTQY